MQNRIWAIVFALGLPLCGGMVTALAVYADTQDLKTKESTHATKDEVTAINKERKVIDKQQTKALNWQAQALDAIADKLDVPLPPRPPMIDGEN